MAVTDLTGYTCVINESPIASSAINRSINYVSNNIEYYNIKVENINGRTKILYLRPNFSDLQVYDTNYGWSNEAYKTISITGGTDVTNTTLISWLEANGTLTPPTPIGYEVTFVTNGGTSIAKLEDVEELPAPLPTTTKTNNIFVGWFYDSGFEEQAFSGDTISSNITLYAKWYANMSDFYEDVADEIRIKNGETEPIKHTDFAYKIKNIQGAKPEETKTVTPNFASGNVVVTPTSGKVMTQVTINKDSNLIAGNIKKDVTVHGITGNSFIAIELTQAQYDALTTKDSNTYYLING